MGLVGAEEDKAAGPVATSGRTAARSRANPVNPFL